MNTYEAEVAAGQRFEFGKNWEHFLEILDDRRIEAAKQSLQDYLEVDRLDGNTFLDAGSGSGLFSLAARMLGASVRSFDFDPHSVACTLELKRRYFPDDDAWRVDQGSVLDQDYLNSLGTFDIVYSWGVLHHTGNMNAALDNVAALVKRGGKLYIAIYNDQGGASRRWLAVKKLYNQASHQFKKAIVIVVFGFFTARAVLVDLFRFQNPLRRVKTSASSTRGMDRWRDCIDWVGGYPFEVAKPEHILNVYRKYGFELVRLKTCAGGLGCNEYVFIQSISLDHALA